LGPKKKFLQCQQFISETIQETLSKKVACLLITEDSAGTLEAKEIRELRKYPFFQVKYLNSSPLVCFAIFDRKELMLITTPELEYSESSVIWSNNPSLIELAQTYFERLWKQA
jgi:hypothetical protein